MKGLLSCIGLMMAFALPLQAFANRAVGNGGHGISCPGVQKIEAIDAYEARTYRPLDLGSNGLSVEEKLETVFERLGRFSPYAVANLRVRLAEFFHTTRYVNYELQLVKDYGNFKHPNPKCKIVQVAVQTWSALPGERAYQIDARLWARMDNDSRAALILHELIFGVVLQSDGNPDSSAVRAYLTPLLNGTWDDFDLSQYEMFVRRLTSSTQEVNKFFFAIHFGVPLEGSGYRYSSFGRSSIKLWEEPSILPVDTGNGDIRAMTLRPRLIGNSFESNVEFARADDGQWFVKGALAQIVDGKIVIDGQEVEVAAVKYEGGGYSYSGTIYDLKIPRTLTVFGSSIPGVKKIGFKPTGVITVEAQKSARLQRRSEAGQYTVFAEKVGFYANGQLAEGVLVEHAPLKVGKRSYNFLKGNWIEFHESGAVREGTLRKGTEFIWARDGATYRLTRDIGRVIFNEAGEMTSCYGDCSAD